MSASGRRAAMNAPKRQAHQYESKDPAAMKDPAALAARPSSVRFGSSRTPARISLRNSLRISCGLCAAALMLAATPQPGSAATADLFPAKASSSAIASAPIAAPGAHTTLADARADTPTQARPAARTASHPANAQRAKRPRIVRTASASPRLLRVPARLRTARRVPPAAIATSYRADCFWFSCGPRVSWLFLGIGF